MVETWLETEALRQFHHPELFKQLKIIPGPFIKMEGRMPFLSKQLRILRAK
jgi:hypothetical protein